MKKRKWIWIGLAVILVVSVLLLSNPQVRTNLFVRLYHDDIEEGLRINAGVPADDAVLFGYKYVNTWEGEHSMVEFLIGIRGGDYYGCYYSPDDVPLAFQNTEAEQDSRTVVEWHTFDEMVRLINEQEFDRVQGKYNLDRNYIDSLLDQFEEDD